MMISLKSAFPVAATLIACVIAGKFLYHDAMLWGDSLNMMSPYPLIDAANNSQNVPDNALSYIKSWYVGQNGRISQAMLVSLVHLYSKYFVANPQDFPSWLMRSLSLAFMILTGYSIAKSFKEITKRTYIAVAAGCFFVAIWVFNEINLYVNNIFDVTLIGYCLPTFLLFQMFALSSRLQDRMMMKFSILGYFAFYVFLSLFSEHMLIATACVSTLGYLVASSKPFQITIRKAAFIVCMLFSSVASAIVFLMSPGQIWRTNIVVNKNASIDWNQFLTWYKTSISQAHEILIGNYFSDPKTPSLIHSIIILGILLFMSINIKKAWSDPVKNLQHLPRIKCAFLALGFIGSFHICMATGLFSGYLPFWAMQLPLSLLLVGIMFFFGGLAISIEERYAGQISGSRIALGISVSSALILIIIIRAPGVSQVFLEIMEHNRYRREMYAEIDRLYATGIREILLSDFPRTRHTWTIEPQWGLNSYVRWKKMDGLTLYEAAETGGNPVAHFAQVHPSRKSRYLKSTN